jgi:hypothetical protein
VRKQFVIVAVVALALVAGCGAAAPSGRDIETATPTTLSVASPTPRVAPVATPAPTVTPITTPAPTVEPSPSAAIAPAGKIDPFAGQPYRLRLPAGWQAYDLNDAASQAAFDAYARSNPQMAEAIDSFLTNPNVRMVVNPLLGNAVIVMALPSQGLPLETIGASLTAQFRIVPNVIRAPVAKSVTLPAGSGFQWNIAISSPNGLGRPIRVNESVYLVTDGPTAFVAVFVKPKGGVLPDETKIIKSLRFRS